MDLQEPPEVDAGQKGSRQGHVYSVDLEVCRETARCLLVPFTPSTYSVSPALTDREPDSGHIWMQFPLKLMLKNPTESLEPEGKQKSERF